MKELVYLNHVMSKHVATFLTHDDGITVDYRDFSSPTRLVLPLFEPSPALRVVPLGLVLIVDASIMLAISLSCPPQNLRLALRIVLPGEDKYVFENVGDEMQIAPRNSVGLRTI